MIRIVSTFLMLFLSAGFAAGQPEPVNSPNDDYEIEDVRNLPQDFSALDPFRQESAPDRQCHGMLYEEFRKQYYLPWKSMEPLSNVDRAAQSMRAYAQRQWYGENNRRVSQKYLAGLVDNCDLPHFPSLNSRAVALVSTAMRVLPTGRPLFRKAAGFPFDALQNTELKTNEPIKVLHRSSDGVWVFVETADGNGWVELRDIAFVDEQMVARWIALPQVVVVADGMPLQAEHGLFAQRVKLGALFPVVAENGAEFTVEVAVSDGSRKAAALVVPLPKMSAARFPLELSAPAITRIGNQLIGKPYGWGELYQHRDCSAMLRDFFSPFGIWLPRGSYNQIHSGKSISLYGLSAADKERSITAFAVPYLTLVYLRGHIMLYVGTLRDRPLVFHSLWGVSVNGEDGAAEKQVVGKSVISTLTPGSELRLTYGSLLDMVRSMRVVTDRCAVVP